MGIEERFWSKVRKTNGCWLWTACSTSGNYGQFWVSGRHHLAHRVAYEFMHGPIPKGLVIDHICRNPACVRPDHLRAVTQRQNLLHGPTIIVAEISRTECRKGHPLSGKNLRITKEGWRECLACTRARWKRAEVNKAAVRRANRPR